MKDPSPGGPSLASAAEGYPLPGRTWRENIPLAVAGSEEGGPRTVVGLRVTNAGSDMGSITPMLADIERRTGDLPQVHLADANHAKHLCIETATRDGVEAVIAVPRRAGALEDASPEVAAWRERMATEEAKRLYRARDGLVELLSAHFKARFGIDRVLVRGLPKVRCVVLVAGLAFYESADYERLLEGAPTPTNGPISSRYSAGARTSASGPRHEASAPARH